MSDIEAILGNWDPGKNSGDASKNSGSRAPASPTHTSQNASFKRATSGAAAAKHGEAYVD